MSEPDTTPPKPWPWATRHWLSDHRWAEFEEGSACQRCGVLLRDFYAVAYGLGLPCDGEAVEP